MGRINPFYDLKKDTKGFKGMRVCVCVCVCVCVSVNLSRAFVKYTILLRFVGLWHLHAVF